MTSAISFRVFCEYFHTGTGRNRQRRKGVRAQDELVLTGEDWVVYWMYGYSSHLTYHTSVV